MLAELRKSRTPLEIGLLVALAFFLPLVEAPKNWAWLGYAAVWLANRIRARDFGGRWDLWDTLIALWIASGYLVAAFAGLDGGEWRGATDLARYASILWLVKRGGYAARELRWVLGALVASTIVGLAVGYARLWSGIGKSGTLQLHSVGHVNHTAIYLAIMLGLCASWIFARWKAWRAGRRAAAAAVAALVLASLMVTASRGAIGVGLAMLLVLGAAWWPRWRAPLVASIAAVAVVAAGALALGAEVIRRHEYYVAAQNVLSLRDGVWRMSLAAWERHPWFGVGMDNYSRITGDLVKAWRAEAGKDFDPARYVRFPHAHSLYFNTLAERGVAGAAALGAVLGAWLWWLVRRRPAARDTDLEWLLWGAAASAFLVTAGAGIVNTTLHHEHGILAALLLGLWLSRLKARQAS
jgi:O-antigen ligase